MLDYVVKQSVPKCNLTNVSWGHTVYQAVLSSKRYKDRWNLVPTLETLKLVGETHITGQLRYAQGTVGAPRRATVPQPSDMMSGLSHGSHTKGGWKDVLGTENSLERSNGLVWLKTKLGVLRSRERQKMRLERQAEIRSCRALKKLISSWWMVETTKGLLIENSHGWQEGGLERNKANNDPQEKWWGPASEHW